MILSLPNAHADKSRSVDDDRPGCPTTGLIRRSDKMRPDLVTAAQGSMSRIDKMMLGLVNLAQIAVVDDDKVTAERLEPQHKSELMAN